MENLLFTLRFDGTAYHGWQVQENAPTVQQTFGEAVEHICGAKPNVIGCSRTDAGVHANMYCCNVRMQSSLSTDKWIKALNAVLPRDIAVTDCREVDYNFHARYDCSGKEYVYKILNSKTRDPFLEKYCYHYPYALDTDMLNIQAQDFLGRHDFSSFCASGSSTKDNVRCVGNAKVERCGDEVFFSFEADGFLYNMVRIMAGTLIDISRGKLKCGSIPDIIAAKDRAAAGVTAPAHGLFLNKVYYPDFQEVQREKD